MKKRELFHSRWYLMSLGIRQWQLNSEPHYCSAMGRSRKVSQWQDTTVLDIGIDLTGFNCILLKQLSANRFIKGYHVGREVYYTVHSFTAPSPPTEVGVFSLIIHHLSQLMKRGLLNRSYQAMSHPTIFDLVPDIIVHRGIPILVSQ